MDKVRTSITKEVDLSILLCTIVESIAELFGYSQVSLYLLEGDMLILQHAVGYEQVIQKIPLTQGISGRVVRTGKPVFLEDVRIDPEFLGAIGGIVSEICVPLLMGEEAAGVLNVESTRGVKLTQADSDLMVALSEHISLAIGRGRLFSEIQHRNLFLSALQESTLAILGQLEPAEALKAILAQAARLMDTSHGYIYLVRPKEELLQVETGMGIFTQYIGTTLKSGEGLGGKVWETAASLNIPNYQEWSGHSDKFIDTDFHAVVGIPLVNHSQVVGVLGLAHLEPNKIFSAENVDLLNRFAQLAMLALENANLHTQVKSELTERKEAEQALSESESLYRQAIEVAGAVPYYESYYDNGAKIKYEFIGEGIRQITGYGPEEFTAALWDTLVLDIHLVEDLAGYSLDRAIERVRSGENSIWKCEHRIRHRNGEIRWVFEAAVELRDEHGISHGSIGMYQDITRRKETEASKQKHLDYLAALQKITIELLDRNDVKSLLETISKKAAALLDAKHAFISLDDGDSLLLRAATEGLIHHIDEREKKPGTGVLSQVWQTGKPFQIEHYDTWELRDPNYSDDKLSAVAGVPILRGTSMAGVLVVARIDEDERAFNDDDMDILSHFAELASLVLDNVSLYESALNEIAEREKIEEALTKSEERYRMLFEESPITLWEEDFSEAKKYLDTLQEQGITDIRSYLAQHPEEISNIATRVQGG